ncbi:PadR family transcriptional regulator [Mycobacteroides chelonae]|uniref:PadR family transcriptional regulator n=1 Tax=Mycobacteroides chelonae TaxID=1774 RepID=UPI0008A9B4AF|nr:PadR family transcriptional regulator [Mycobacteroides chelonae]OHT78933.1 PadR family transcriptional regulator [Mycobacteroides chelonae]
MARFFRHGELPLVLLALLAQRPMHGYELMSELSRLFGAGGYQPSPGTVYPAVEALAAEGLLNGQTREGRTVYRTSAEGEQALTSRADVLAGVELRTGARFGRGDSFEKILARFSARIMPSAGRVDPTAVEKILDQAALEITGLARVDDRRRGAKQ